MNNILREKISEGINFTYIPEKKFKTTVVSFSMFTPLSKSEVSKNALLPNLLSHSCKKYPNLKDISIKLESLYGASVNSSLSKLGDCQVINLCAEALSGKFAYENPSNTADLTNLLCEMIFEPNLEDGKFKEENLELEKRQLIEDILSEMNDKKAYASRRCEEIMFENDKFGINILGTIEEAKNLSSEQVTKAWEDLLKSAHIEITVIGKASYEAIISEFKNRFAKINRQPQEMLKTKVKEKAEEIKEVTENMDVSQCKLVMGLCAGTAYPDKDTPAMMVMNALFGGTAQSKLFLNVREKLSLCYYCSSRYNKAKGVIFISSGVEKGKLKEAKKEIINQLKEVKVGNFAESDLAETKMYLSQNMESISDSLSSLASWYISQSFLGEMKSPEELIKEISEVKREKVIEVANKITLDTVYTLCRNDKEDK